MSHANPETGRGSKPALGAYFIIPLLACALTLYFMASTRGLLWEAKATGDVIGVILLGLCIAQFIRLGVKVARGEGTLGLGELVTNTPFNRQRLWLLSLTAAFILLLPWIGTTVGLFIVLIAMMRLLGVHDWRILASVAGGTAAAVHILLIYLLGSQLPQGVFKSLFAAIGI